MSQVIWRSIIIIFFQVPSSHGISVSEVIFLLIWLWTYFPSDFFFFVLLISFDALELLFFNRKKTDEISAGFTAYWYPPNPEEILPLLLFYQVSTFTQHFIFSRANTEHTYTHKNPNNLQTEPELLSLLLNHHVKFCQSGVLLLTFLRRYREHGETLKFLGKGKYFVYPILTYLTALPVLPVLAHQDILKIYSDATRNTDRHVQEQSPSPNIHKDATTGLGKPGCRSPQKLLPS